MLLLAFAPSVRAGGACCGSSTAHGMVPHAAAATIDEGAADEVAGQGRCCCATNCHCAPADPAPACGCKVPAPKPLPGAPVGPNPSLPGAAPTSVVALEAPPHVAAAQRLCAATASGLPNVLLPGRSRQEALSIWLI